MRKIVPIIALSAVVLASPVTAFAQDRAVPAGDQLEQTPPIDVTRQELQAAPPSDRTQEKVDDVRKDGAAVR